VKKDAVKLQQSEELIERIRLENESSLVKGWSVGKVKTTEGKAATNLDSLRMIAHCRLVMTCISVKTENHGHGSMETCYKKDFLKMAYFKNWDMKR
jgi:hypothetical protein